MSHSLRMRATLAPAVAAAVLVSATPMRAAESEPTDASSSPSPPGRPRIGLCLAGGGAKGMAHVGVLRVLEEMRIPIDYVGGTSMGAIVGGLYASGMSPGELEHLLVSQNWWDLLDDSTPRRDLPLRRKERQARYVLDLELGLRGWKLVLPNAFAGGQKLNNVLAAATAHVGTIDDFDKLPTPYRAVGTDLHTGEAFVLDHGNLALAMRASMAIPGVFTPVEIDGRLLVDGGVVLNIPVDVVRKMGADIVIAVDVSGAGDWASRDREFDSAAAIVGQMMVIFQRPGQDAQLAKADLVIDAGVVEQGAGDFHKGPEIIAIGEHAARAVAAELAQFQVDETEYASFMDGRRLQPVTTPVVREVTVSGNERVDPRIISNKIATTPGDDLDVPRVHHDAARIYGLGDFVTVLHFIQPTGDGYDVDYHVTEKPWGPGYVHFGLRIETDFDNDAYWDMLLNYTRRNINVLGAEWLLDFKIGREKGVFTDFYQPLDFGGTFFIDPSFAASSEKIDVYDGRDRIAEYEVNTAGGALDLGASLADYGEARIGYAYGAVDTSVGVGDPDLPTSTDDVAALQARFVLDRLDHAFFARKGYRLDVRGRVAREQLGSEISYEQGEAACSGYTSRGSHTGWIRVRAGSSFGSDIPLYDQFAMGGIEDFAALAPGQLRGPYVGVASLGYRYRIGRLPPGLGDGLYLGVRGDAGNVWEAKDDISPDDVIYSGMVAAAADTVIGPCYVGVAQAEDGYRRAFLALGTQF